MEHVLPSTPLASSKRAIQKPRAGFEVNRKPRDSAAAVPYLFIPPRLHARQAAVLELGFQFLRAYAQAGRIPPTTARLAYLDDVQWIVLVGSR